MNMFRTIRTYGIASVLMTLPGVALAQGLTGTVPFAGTAGGNLPNAIITIVNVLLVIAALIAALMLIIGGVRYITSQGEEDAANKAKGTILYAIIGLIVIGLSAAVVNFVVGAIQAA